ncbi:hypothetical protein B0H13DRAFT_2664945, partial [Mycena leptocephala]
MSVGRVTSVSEARDEAIGTLPESKGGSEAPKEKSLDETEGSSHRTPRHVFSTSDYMIELKITPLDAFAELNDTTGARIRYLTRREIASSHDPVEVVHIAPIANFIPVHTHLGPGQPRNMRAYDHNTNIIPWPILSGSWDLGKRVPSESKKRRSYKLRFSLTPHEDRRYLNVEFDLGSNHLWVYGTECKGHASRPYRWPRSPALFWFPQSADRDHKASERVYTAKYAEVSFAEYQLFTDFVYLRPYWSPLPVQEPDKAWPHLTFGVASQVSPSYRRALTSGILGLGRRSVLDNKLTSSAVSRKFNQCVLPLIRKSDVPSANSASLSEPGAH